MKDGGRLVSWTEGQARPWIQNSDHSLMRCGLSVWFLFPFRLQLIIFPLISSFLPRVYLSFFPPPSLSSPIFIFPLIKHNIKSEIVSIKYGLRSLYKMLAVDESGFYFYLFCKLALIKWPWLMPLDYSVPFGVKGSCSGKKKKQYPFLPWIFEVHPSKLTLYEFRWYHITLLPLHPMALGSGLCFAAMSWQESVKCYPDECWDLSHQCLRWSWAPPHSSASQTHYR